MEIGGSNSGFEVIAGGLGSSSAVGGGALLMTGAAAAPAPSSTTATGVGTEAQQVAALTNAVNIVNALAQALAAQRQLSGEGATFEQRVLELLNQQRAAYGLGQLSYSAQLDAAATGHNAQMMATGSMAHEGIGDGDPQSRVRATGFAGAWGENVAVGQTTPEQVVAEWMASPGHRRNILDPTYTQVGNAYGVAASGRPFWAQSFGA
ncbi:MAG: SCP-like extracellular [Thermoleophilia bacterium]|nr:SCP-like extracellular [Thermoleophilia bacterium]